MQTGRVLARLNLNNSMHIRSFFNGLLTGIVLGILFAPASGETTRRRLGKKIDDTQDSATADETLIVVEAPVLVTMAAIAVENDDNRLQ